MIRIGRIGKGTKVHMHVDGKTCGAGRGAKLTEVISPDMLQWIVLADLCTNCFRARRIQRASEVNAYGRNWIAPLDTFLAKVGEKLPPANGTSAERLAQIKAELIARFAA